MTGFKKFKAVWKNGNEKWFASKQSAISFCKKNNWWLIQIYTPFQSSPISSLSV